MILIKKEDKKTPIGAPKKGIRDYVSRNTPQFAKVGYPVIIKVRTGYSYFVDAKFEVLVTFVPQGLFWIEGSRVKDKALMDAVM